MKYLCLVYSEQKKLETMTDDECMEYDAAIRKSGHCIASEALQPVETATSVRVRSGKISITDGPFAETKEQLAGFYLIEAQNLDRAIEIASRIPPARVGTIEVRPVRELQSTKGERRDPNR
ncbi:MAG TPA: YciI family protein [Bacteroidota bacterium]|nr:YciI family protein [Bacteroidota bacterium]